MKAGGREELWDAEGESGQAWGALPSGLSSRRWGGPGALLLGLLSVVVFLTAARSRPTDPTGLGSTVRTGP